MSVCVCVFSLYKSNDDKDILKVIAVVFCCDDACVVTTHSS
jgi:hypothetical protein